MAVPRVRHLLQRPAGTFRICVIDRTPHGFISGNFGSRIVVGRPRPVNGSVSIHLDGLATIGSYGWRVAGSEDNMDVGRGACVDVIASYDGAWNASDVDERRRLLEAALTDDCDLVEPRGRFRGRQAILERINGFSDRFPGARVDITTKVDEHNGFARYGWRVVDRGGNLLLEGIDVVERADDGRLRTVVMFFGELHSR